MTWRAPSISPYVEERALTEREHYSKVLEVGAGTYCSHVMVSHQRSFSPKALHMVSIDPPPPPLLTRQWMPFNSQETKVKK